MAQGQIIEGRVRGKEKGGGRGREKEGERGGGRGGGNYSLPDQQAQFCPHTSQTSQPDKQQTATATDKKHIYKSESGADKIATLTQLASEYPNSSKIT